MAQPYVGEIRIFAGNFPPSGWMFCNGATLPISENETLFNLIGTTYGGDGQETFQLPDLQSRVPIHMGTGPDGTTYQIGESAGTETVTLTTQQIPSHTHQLTATSVVATGTNPSQNVPAKAPVLATQAYGTDNPPDTLNAGAIGQAGGNQPHENCQPFLCVNFIISLFGVFPSPT